MQRLMLARLYIISKKCMAALFDWKQHKPFQILTPCTDVQSVYRTPHSDALSSMQTGTCKNGLKLPTVRVITQTTDVVLMTYRL